MSNAYNYTVNCPYYVKWGKLQTFFKYFHLSTNKHKKYVIFFTISVDMAMR